MFLELLPFEFVDFVPESIVEIIQNQLGGEIKSHEVVSFENAQCFSPKKILLNEKFSVVQFFFSIPEAGRSLQWCIESLNYLRVSPRVTFGLTEKNELASIIVTDFAKRIYYNDFIMEGNIDGNEKRFNNFVVLNQQFFDKNMSGNDYEAHVTRYLKKFNPLEDKSIYSITEASVLTAFVSKKKWYHKLNNYQ